MADLKLDLVNKLNNEKYYEEIELIRLAGDPNMNYKDKIDTMSFKLGTITLLNAKIGLIEQYFQEPTHQNAPAPAGEKVAATPAPEGQVPQGQVHRGQSHGE